MPLVPPAPTARGNPTGKKLNDGFSTKVTFALAPTISLWEKEVTPPGFDGEEKIDTTTMFNTDLRTFQPRVLKTQTDGSMTCAYDPAALTALITLINKPTTVTVTFPDKSSWAFYGWLQSFVPGTDVEGEQPTAECTITAGNQDPGGFEALPFYTAPPTVFAASGPDELLGEAA